MRREAQETLEQNFTPSLARRLSRQFIEQTRQSVPRSPSSARDSNMYCQSPTRDLESLVGAGPSEIAKLRYSTSTTSDRTEYRGRSLDRGIRKTNSLLEPCRHDKSERHSPRRSISLFDDDGCDDGRRLLPSLPKHVMTLGRRYKESVRPNVVGNVTRDSFHGHRTDKIQEEPGDDTYLPVRKEGIDNVAEEVSTLEDTSISVSNSMDNTATVVSTATWSVSPTESASNLGDCGNSICHRPDLSKSFENRLLAAENLIKESKLKNLQQFNPNLSCNYRDTDKCDKESLTTISEPLSSGCNSVASKRRSCIPNLRLRSLTRESSMSAERGKALTGSPDDASDHAGSINQERSILSKLFRGTGKEAEPKDGSRSQKPKRRISRFLRPDFFDTPREESRYVKEKEAQRAAENERRKSRFMRRKNESGERKEDEKICKQLKNEINALQKDKLGSAASAASSFSSSSPSSSPSSFLEDKERAKVERGSKSGFLHSLEKKLEKLRSNDETTTTTTTSGGSISSDLAKARGLREYSAPPVECPPAESSLPEVKRTLSVEALSRRGGPSKEDCKRNVPSKERRVTSVLGLFKTTTDIAKRSANNAANVSKLKRSPPKCVKSVVEPSLEEDVAATSKIPTTKVIKPTRGPPENKRSPEKVASELKRSPPKEKTKEKEIAKERKPPFVQEKRSRELKRAPERPAPSSDSSASSSVDKIKLDRVGSPKKMSSDQSESLRKVVQDKHAESIVSLNSEDKKLIKTKRNISSSLVVGRNESVSRIETQHDKAELCRQGEDKVDNKIKKPVKSKEDTARKNDNDGSRKKRIVRVVRKVVKKASDSSGSKSDEKGKSPKSLTKKEKSPEGLIVTARREQDSVQGNDPDSLQTATRSSCSKQPKPASPAKSRDTQHITENTNTSQMKTDERTRAASTDQLETINVSSTANSQSCPSCQGVSSAAARIDSTFNICQSKQQPLEQRPSRASLKLDLSKIPQHAFRHATPRRDSPRSDSPKANPAIPSAGSPKTDDPIAKSGSGKLIECLSKMTHHANITGNKIIIDKPLRAKDVAELKREVTECARIIESHVGSRDDRSSQRPLDHITFVSDQLKEIVQDESREVKLNPCQGVNDISDHGVTGKEAKELQDDCASDVLSPEEPESFDSWSICSADLNHNRGDLHSPTSPSYSLFTRGDSSESVIDRIRRRSFYSRFNDRKRPSLTAPPPGMSSLVTLPRRFSFNSFRERDRSCNYGGPRTR